MTIIIRKLTFKTIIGLLPKERITPQNVIVDAEFDVDLEEMVLDYAILSQNIKEFFISNKFETVEESLSKILNYLKEKYPLIKRIKVQIIKPDILKDCEVGATLERNY